MSSKMEKLLAQYENNFEKEVEEDVTEGYGKISRVMIDGDIIDFDPDIFDGFDLTDSKIVPIMTISKKTAYLSRVVLNLGNKYKAAMDLKINVPTVTKAMKEDHQFLMAVQSCEEYVREHAQSELLTMGLVQNDTRTIGKWLDLQNKKPVQMKKQASRGTINDIDKIAEEQREEEEAKEAEIQEFIDMEV